MMENPEKQSSFLEEIESRQNDAMDQLDQLNARVEDILSEYLATRENKVNYKMKKANAEYLKYRESVKKVSFSDDKTDTSSSAEERESAPGEERAIDLL